jgi:NAD(P)-dependent dehydrogenase (short-subunit alcohol dehydrogenase family)
MNRRYEGKVAVVTGAAGGIGRALALGYAGEGAELVILDINAEGLEETALLVRQCGTGCTARRIDLSDEEQIAEVGKALCEAFPLIHVLYNNAAIVYGDILSPVDAAGMEQWKHYLAVNSLAPLFLSVALHPSLAAADGCIINQSSIGAYAPKTIYGVTKSVLNQLTYSMAGLFAKDGIRVNAIAPGMIETPGSVGGLTPERYSEVQSMQMLDERGAPDDIVRLGLFLGSDEARFITSEVVHCDAGSSMRGWRD